MSDSKDLRGFDGAPLAVMLYRCYTHYKMIADPL